MHPLRTASVVLALAGLSACGEPASAPIGAATGGDASGFRASQAATAESAGLPASFTTEIGMRFELVPGGTRVHGSPRDDPRHGEDETPHEVRLVGPFYLAAREATRREVAAWRGEPAPADGDAPATGLSHADAVAFAAWLSERDPRHAFRLPTEAEWERAAQEAGASGAIEGMSSGPWEWCADRYAPYPDWSVTNPECVDPGPDCVVRGGDGARAAQRRHLPPEHGDASTGVRLLAPLAYGKADAGRATIVFESVDTDGDEHILAQVKDLEVRIITVVDRLASRQAGRELPWQTIPGRRTPFRWRVPPGRYYAQCQIPGSSEMRGVEIKFDADRPEVTVHLPTPHEGATLPEPE